MTWPLLTSQLLSQNSHPQVLPHETSQARPVSLSLPYLTPLRWPSLSPSMVLHPPPHGLLRLPTVPKLCCPFPSGSLTPALPSLRAPCKPELAFTIFTSPVPHSGLDPEQRALGLSSQGCHCLRGTGCIWLMPAVLEFPVGSRGPELTKRVPLSWEPGLGGRTGPCPFSKGLSQSRYVI